jgi:hypothetical protein
LNEGPQQGRQLPRHLIRSPVDVVTDFMTEVAECVLRHIEIEKDPSTLRDYPIDLVITHPAQWPQPAMNLTVRAVTKAFERIFSSVDATFRHVMLASEPEACAQVTMKDAIDGNLSNLRQVGGFFFPES